MACLYTLTLTRHPGECSGAISSLFVGSLLLSCVSSKDGKKKKKNEKEAAGKGKFDECVSNAFFADKKVDKSVKCQKMHQSPRRHP